MVPEQRLVNGWLKRVLLRKVDYDKRMVQSLHLFLNSFGMPASAHILEDGLRYSRTVSSQGPVTITISIMPTHSHQSSSPISARNADTKEGKVIRIVTGAIYCGIVLYLVKPHA